MYTRRQPQDGYTVTSQTQHIGRDALHILHGVDDHQFSPYDQQLVDYIYNHISQPSLTRPRKLVEPQESDQSQIGQSKFVDQLLSGRRNGFFVQCGAVDGLTVNTSPTRCSSNWSGTGPGCLSRQTRTITEHCWTRTVVRA